MATVCVPRWRTVDGETVEDVAEVEVSVEVAAVLAEREPRLKETPYTDCSSAKNDRAGLDPDAIDPGSGMRRQNNRPMPAGNPWEGPRLYFGILLGSTLPGWQPNLRDEQGRCGVCHDADEEGEEGRQEGGQGEGEEEEVMSADGHPGRPAHVAGRPW